MAPPLHICIIDDDPIVQFTLRKQIEHLPVPCEIHAFLDGEQAFQFFLKKPKSLPDLIFLDINMPILNGWGFMEKFAPLYPSLQKKILLYVLSSSDFEDDIEKSKNYPIISDYLIKPLIGDAFINAFKPLLQSNKSSLKTIEK